MTEILGVDPDDYIGYGEPGSSWLGGAVRDSHSDSEVGRFLAKRVKEAEPRIQQLKQELRAKFAGKAALTDDTTD